MAENSLQARKSQLQALRVEYESLQSRLRGVSVQKPGSRSLQVSIIILYTLTSQIDLGPLSTTPGLTVIKDGRLHVNDNGRSIETTPREAADLAAKRIREVDDALEQFDRLARGDLSVLDQDLNEDMEALNEDGEPFVDLGHYVDGPAPKPAPTPREVHSTPLTDAELSRAHVKSNVDALYASLIAEEEQEVQRDVERAKAGEDDALPWQDLDRAQPTAPEPTPRPAPRKRVSFDVPESDQDEKPRPAPPTPMRPIREQVVERPPEPKQRRLEDMIKIVEREVTGEETFDDDDESDSDELYSDDESEAGDPLVHLDDLMHNRQIALEYHRKRHGMLRDPVAPLEDDDDLIIDDDGTVLPRSQQSRFRSGPAETMQTATMVLPSAIVTEPPTDAVAESSTADFSEDVQARLEALKTGTGDVDVDQKPTPVVAKPELSVPPIREVSERKIDERPAAPSAPKPSGKVSRSRQ